MKVYKKRGATNYTEKKLLRQLEPVIKNLAEKDAAFAQTFKAAETLEELQALHSQYCITDVEEIKEPEEQTPEPKPAATKSDANVDADIRFENPQTPLEDPMNRANPIIRDHVLNDSMAPDNNKKGPEIGGMPNLAEPLSHEDAFRLPDEDLDPKERKERQKQQAEQNKTDNGGKKTEGINPAFDELTQQRKSKQTKRFAKYIVEFFAMGLEQGYVWFVTKDISEIKLTEYEMQGKIDPNHLEFMVSLSEEQQVTIRQFFQMQCQQAKIQGKVSEDDKKELTDALADVLMEKGFAPTPMQSLLIVAGQIVVSKALPAFMQVQQNNSIIKQLKSMAGNTEDQENTVEDQNNSSVNQNGAPEPAGKSEATEENPSTELTVIE